LQLFRLIDVEKVVIDGHNESVMIDRIDPLHNTVLITRQVALY
jgi:hypothetical protein